MNNEIDYDRDNPPIWDCIEFRDFLMVQEHLDRLLEIRGLREEIDPDMRYSVSFSAAGEVLRDRRGRPKRGSRVEEVQSVAVGTFTVTPGAHSQRAAPVPGLPPVPPPSARRVTKLTPEQMREHRTRWNNGTKLEY